MGVEVWGCCSAELGEHTREAAGQRHGSGSCQILHCDGVGRLFVDAANDEIPWHANATFLFLKMFMIFVGADELSR